MKVTYVGPGPATRFFDQGIEREVAAGQTVDVHPDTAGTAPDPRIEAAHLELAEATAALDHATCVALRAEIVDLNPGCGLLAQPSNWQTASPSKPKPASKDGE